MKRNSNKENSNTISNQAVKDVQNEKEEELNAYNEIDEGNKINDEITKKNNRETIINNLFNDIKSIRAELDSYKNEFQLLRSNAQVLGFNVTEIQNKAHNFNNDVHGLRNDAHEIQYDTNELRNEVHDIKNDVHEVGNELNNLRNILDNYFGLLIFNENNNEGQNKNINYDELIEEKELDQKSFEKYKEEKCAICLEDFNIGNKVCNLPCLHIYHSFYIKNWLKIRGKCPLCGNDLLIQKNS